MGGECRLTGHSDAIFLTLCRFLRSTSAKAEVRGFTGAPDYPGEGSHWPLPRGLPRMHPVQSCLELDMNLI